MLVARHLRKVYADNVVVHDLNLSVAAGRTLALLGSSGSGKTTTLRMFNRLIEPTSGLITLNGIDTRQLPLTELRRQMGYVIQTIGLFPHYTVSENIGVVPRLLGWSADRIRRRAHDLLTRVDLPPEQYARRYPHELSGGQQQRVGIARALAADPPVILLDEPFGALDPVTRQALRSDFLKLDELRQKTIVLVTHDVEEAFVLADEICLLHEGVVQQIGPPDALLFQPANAYVRAFIGDQLIPLARRTTRLTDLAPHLTVVGQKGTALGPQQDVATVATRLLHASGQPHWVHLNGQHYQLDNWLLEQAFLRHLQQQALKQIG